MNPSSSDSPLDTGIHRSLKLAMLATALCWLLTFTLVGLPWSMIGLTITDSQKYFWVAVAFDGNATDNMAAHATSILSETRFPPGYPLFLSLFGPDPSPAGMRAANLGQWLTVLLALGATCRFYITYLGKGLLALSAMAYTLAMPWLFPWSFDLVSEPLFVALLMTICVYGKDKPVARGSFAMCLLFGMLCLTRSLGYPLLPLLAWWLWLRSRSLLRVFTGMAIAVAPILAWKLYQWSLGGAGADSYALWLVHELQALRPNFWQIIWPQWSMFAASFTPTGWNQTLRVSFGSLLVLIAISRLLPAARRGDSSALIAAALLAVLLVWPFPLHFDRLTAPLAPFLVMFALRTSPMQLRHSQTEPMQARRELSGQLIQPGPVRASPIVPIVLTVAALISVWSSAIFPMVAASRTAGSAVEKPFRRSAMAMRTPSDPDQSSKRLAQVLEIATQLDKLVPEDECISTTWPDFIALRTSRRVVASPKPFAWTSQACRYALAIGVWNGSHVGGPDFPMKQEGLEYRLVAQWRENGGEQPLATLIQPPL